MTILFKETFAGVEEPPHFAPLLGHTPDVTLSTATWSAADASLACNFSLGVYIGGVSGIATYGDASGATSYGGPSTVAIRFSVSVGAPPDEFAAQRTGFVIKYGGGVMDFALEYNGADWTLVADGASVVCSPPTDGDRDVGILEIADGLQVLHLLGARIESRIELPNLDGLSYLTLDLTEGMLLNDLSLTPGETAGAVFFDDFSGEGTFVGHAPNIGLNDTDVWNAWPEYNEAATLALTSGYLYCPDESTPETLGFAGYGQNNTDTGGVLRYRASVNFIVGPNTDTAPGTSALLALHTGPQAMTVTKDNAGLLGDAGNWNIAYADGALSLPAATFAPDSVGAIDVVVDIASLTFWINGLSYPFPMRRNSSLGLQTIDIEVGATHKLMSLSIDALGASAGDGTSNAALIAPRATLDAAGSSAAPSGADLSAPMATLEAAGRRSATAFLAAPSCTLYATGHDSTGERSARLTAPRPSLAGYGGASARITAPGPALAATGTVTGWGAAAMAAPAPTLLASGTVSGMGSAGLSAPMASLVGYSGAVCAITLTGRATLQASGTTGGIGGAALVCPLFELTAGGTAQNHGSATLLAPAGRLGATAQAWLVAPGAQLTAIGSAVVAVAYEAYSINLSHRDPEVHDEVTHYTNFPFTHIVRYQGSYFGVAGDGLYLLEGTTDDGVAIHYALKTGTDDFDTPQLKTVAAAYFGGRLGPSATVTLHAGETGAESYSYTTPRGQAAQSHREKFGRGVKSRYFALGLAGEDALVLDSIEFETNTMKRRI